MSEKITFESLPQAVEMILRKIEGLEVVLETLAGTGGTSKDKWMNLTQLCDYLPDHPAKQTVYGWVNSSYIPYYKKGKKLAFLQSEIDQWLASGKRKTDEEIQMEVAKYMESNRFGL